eukprot:jgi/Undpi1/10024/HiC_scaffold_28.g12478.m1
MHAATPAVIVAALVVVCVWSGLLWQLWVLRHSFEIAARAPGLVAVCIVGSLTLLMTVLVHWILLLEGKGLPCFVMLFSSYVWFAVYAVPYSLRAFRLVVAYNTRYRLKYAKYVKSPVIVKAAATIGAGLALAAVLVFYAMPERYSRDKRGCFFFQERHAIVAALALGAGPAGFVMYKLMQVRDVFGIGPENVRVIVPVLISGVVYFTVHELIHRRVLRDSRMVHFLMDMMLVGIQFNILLWSALVPVCRHYGCIGGGKTFVLPVQGHYCRSDCDKQGVCDFAHEGGELAKMFGDFCRKNLCMESWDFIMDSVAYEELRDPEEQFKCFLHILDKYLRPTSPQEVNVGSRTQDRLLHFQTRSTFTNLHEIKRSTILEEAMREIVLLLEHNLLAKFKLTPAMQQRKQKELLALEIKSAREVADGDESMMELMTSASLGRAGSLGTYTSETWQGQ